MVNVASLFVGKDRVVCNHKKAFLSSRIEFRHCDLVGDFEVAQTIEASVVVTNVLDYKLPLDKLRRMTCSTKGSLKSMNNMSISGRTNFSYQDIPCVPLGK